MADKAIIDLGAVLGPGRQRVKLPAGDTIEILHPTELSTAQFSRVVRLWNKRDALSRRLGLLGDDGEKETLTDSQYDELAGELESIEAQAINLICDGDTSKIPPMGREVVASYFFETRAAMAKAVQERTPTLTRVMAGSRARQR